MTYVLANSNGIPVYGDLIVVPVPGDDSAYAMVNIATLDEGQTADLAQNVIKSVQAAQ